jgi:hypothetical protein
VKIEFHIEGAESSAAFAAFLPLWQAARQKDEDAWAAKHPSRPVDNFSDSALPVATPNEVGPTETTGASEVPAKKPRGRAAKAAEPVAEAAPAIRATPEDRQPVDVETVPLAETVEEAEVIGDVFDDAPATVLTREDVKLALAAYAEKFGMAKAQAEGPKLVGAPRLSALPDDQEAFAKAVKALREAVANG